MIDYSNKELMEHVLMAMRLSFNITEDLRLDTDIGPITFNMLSMPGELLKQFDDEHNQIGAELAFLVEAKTPRYTIQFKISPDGWYDNETPPEVKS